MDKHVEALKHILSTRQRWQRDEIHALTRAISALEAINKATVQRVGNAGNVSRVSAWLPVELEGKDVLIIPTDSVRGE